MTKIHALKKNKTNNLPSQALKKVFIAGIGAVGSTLLKQIAANSYVQTIGACNSRHVKWFSPTSDSSSVFSINDHPEKNWDDIINRLKNYEKGSIIFVDATGDNEVSGLYKELLTSGIHIVTASKLANTQSQEYYDELHSLAEANQARFLYETNVGAGLPIIDTLNNLITSDDEIIELNGVLSGTMTYLFSQLDKGELFSKTVIQARTLGYAEPDPRDDLSGEDVARKFLILARRCGLKIEHKEIKVESLIPDHLKDVDSTSFLKRLNEADEEWKSRFEKEHVKGKTIRYTGKLKDGKITVSTQSVPRLSPTGALTGTNNLIEIRTRRYNDQPIIIQGPGAGKEVTAAGVLTDILKIR